jgi:hypothetical protein
MAKAKLAEAYVELRAEGEARINSAFNRVRADSMKTHAALMQVKNTARGVFLGIAGAFGVHLGLSELIGFFKDSISKAAELEHAQIKLRASLRATGNEVGHNSAQLFELAKTLEDTTHVSEESALALLSLGINLGIGIDQVGEMTKAAIGLAEATGTDATTAMETLTKATQGNFRALEKQFPAIKRAQTAEEKLALVQKMANQGLQEREALTHSLTGSIEAMNQSLDDMEKSIGGTLAPTAITFFRMFTAHTVESRVAALQLEQTLYAVAQAMIVAASAGVAWSPKIADQIADLDKQIDKATKDAIAADNKANAGAQMRVKGLHMVADAANKAKHGETDYFAANEAGNAKMIRDEEKLQNVLKGKAERAKARNDANKVTPQPKPEAQTVTPEQAATVRARNDKRRTDSVMEAARNLNRRLSEQVGGFGGSAQGRGMSQMALDRVAGENTKKARAVAEAGGGVGDLLKTQTAKTPTDDPIVIELKKINDKLPQKAVLK